MCGEKGWGGGQGQEKVNYIYIVQYKKSGKKQDSLAQLGRETTVNRKVKIK